MANKKCKDVSCDRPGAVREFCDKHYRKFMKANPKIQRRPYIKGTAQEKLIAHKKHDGDCWVLSFSENDKEYGKIEINGKLKKVHRVSYDWRLLLLKIET